MVTCKFENGNEATLRHVVLHALVEKDGKLLLEKRAPHLLEGGKWSLPGGYLDVNETAEEGVLRELYEETGWTGEVIELLRINSNANRPKEDRQNVALEFIVKPLEKIGTGDHEVSDLAWVALEDIPDANELAFDHGETIALYKRYKQQERK
jgi:8-oxo-dGTP diphosphatase